MSRRDFLHLGVVGAGALGLAVLAEGCGKPAPNVLNAPSLGALIKARTDAGATNDLQISVSGTDLVAGTPSNLIFFLQRKNGDLVHGLDTRVWLAPSIDPAATSSPMGPFPAPWFGYAHPGGDPPLPQGLNGLAFTFSQGGLWTLVAETTTGTHLVGQSVVQNDGHGVKAKGQNGVPIPGDHALASVTPTAANPMGLDKVCTRNPPCDMHQITLKDAIANGKPTAFTVATPQYCTSRNCGPSLDELISVEATLRDKVNFVHVEPYANQAAAEQGTPIPVVNDWHMESEPWLILIDRTGVITDRFDGGFAAGQISAALQPLVG